MDAIEAATNARPGYATPRRDPVRLAWGVLLVAFAIFCLLCVSSFVAVYYFLFESTVPMSVVAQPSRGTGGITGSDLSERVLRAAETLPNARSILRTASQTQVVVYFRDPQRDNALVALVTLHDTTEASFESALRPRFEWSNVGYRINLDNVFGQVDVLIADDLPHDIELNLISKRSPIPGARHSALVKLGDSGRYSIDVNTERVRAVNYRGEMVLADPEYRFGRPVSSGARGIISHAEREGGSVLTLDDIQVAANEYTNLLENSTFRDVVASVGDNSQPISLPTRWGCSQDYQSTPRGAYQAILQDGSTVLQLARGENATTPAGTFCKQGRAQGENWIDVSAYNYIELRVMLNIQYQSLQGCGEKGSECPLIVRIDYEYQTPEGGNASAELFFGFYSLGMRPDYPLRCESCWQDHIQIQEQVWYTYKSGNILSLFPVDRRPVAISAVEFYASGHQYDTRVSEVSLNAGTLPAPDNVPTQ